MSHYPYGYGQNYGQAPTQQPQYPYQHPPPASYPPPPTYHPAPFEQAYPPPGPPGVSDSPYNVSASSFDYNASQIPGLGITGTPTAPASSPFNGPPGINPWAPGTGPQSTPAITIRHQYQQFPSSRNAQKSSPAAPTHQRPPAKPSSTLRAPQLSIQIADMEEGELSEGQFEDLYEPREPKETTSENPKIISSVTQTAAPPRSASVIEDAEPDLYGDDEEEGEITAENEIADQARARSGSYSPFLAVDEAFNSTPQSPAPATRQTTSTVKATYLPSQPQASKPSQPLPALPGLGLHHLGQSAALSSSNMQANSLAEKTAQLPSNTGIKSPESLAQAKREAQEAVLRLWPLGVQYQNYIDEGFKEGVIREIFTELNLNVAMKPAAEEAKSTMSCQTQPSPEVVKTQPPGDVSQPSQTQGKPAPVQDKAGKPEARNERIARLLAAQQAKKAATSASTAKPTTAPDTTAKTPALPSSIPTKPKGSSDKNLLLQQKMAALREQKESRGAQSPKPQGNKGIAPLAAQPSAAETPAIASTPSGQIIAPTGPAAMRSQLKASQKDTAHERTQPGPKVGPQAAHNQAAISTPRLSTPVASQPGPATGRKRPVAADFDDYSSTVGPLKRPYIQDPNETILVIDVSDGSDDEDMDMDSDGDDLPIESSAANQPSTSDRNGPSVRDFPPLTDTPSRQFGSSRPSTPGSSIHVKKRKTELELKEAAIEQMKQRIAQAVAQKAMQKASKTSSGSQTPNQEATTPDPRDLEAVLPTIQRAASASSASLPTSTSAQASGEGSSSKFPKASHLARLRDRARSERRGRIVSLDLPRVDSSLQEKVDRLNKLREEETRLQLEIDKGMAEKKILTDELARLDADTSEVQSQPNGAGPREPSTPEPPPTRELSPEGASQPASADSSESSDDATSGDVSMEPESPQNTSDTNKPTQPEDPASGLSPVPFSQDGPKGQSDDSVPGQQEQSLPAAGKDTSIDPFESHVSDTPWNGSHAGSREEPGHDADSGDAGDDDVAMEESPVNMPSSSPKPNDSQASDSEDDDMDLDLASTAADPSEQPASDDGEVGNITANAQSSESNQISSVTAPREAVLELENGVSRELDVDSVAAPSSTFVPYKSPLAYFRSYRFHPDYQTTVTGGLKSLTYSNKIDPKLELCPYELSGQPCQDGEQCAFQHFRSILAADDQILLELGKSDGYEDKSRFIQGLRELLQNFRTSKVKDFETIAQGIIDYRARFLGDKSKVLNLDGVVL